MLPKQRDGFTALIECVMSLLYRARRFLQLQIKRKLRGKQQDTFDKRFQFGLALESVCASQHQRRVMQGEGCLVRAVKMRGNFGVAAESDARNASRIFLA